jgi:hypothetical protein
MDLYPKQKDPSSEEDDCEHVINDSVCEKCFCYITEFDSRPKFSIGIQRVSGADYISGVSNAVHGVFKTFSDKANISDFPKSTVAAVCFLYDKISGKSVMRGTQRLGVIAACLNQVMIERKVFLGEKNLLVLFGIRKKDLSNGQTLLASVVTLLFPKITDVIKGLARVIGIKNEALIDLAVRFGEVLKSTDHLFVKSSVSAVGAGFLYTFIEMKPGVKDFISKKFEFNIQTFSKASNVSKNIINDIYMTAKALIERNETIEAGEVKGPPKARPKSKGKKSMVKGTKGGK